jgi:hypothetical protein
MINSDRHAPLRPAFAVFAFGFTTLLIAACNGETSVPSGISALPAQGAKPRGSTPKPSPTPYQWTFTTVNDGGSTAYNCVMGIDELNQVVGSYGGTSSAPSQGFTTEYPYTKFKNVDYPGGVSTVATSMSSNRLFAGYYVDNKEGAHTWGWIRDKGVWTQYKDLKTPKGAGSVNELLGINDNQISVGFYINSYGDDIPYELAEGHYLQLDPPDYVSATANGVNLTGILTGTETLADGTIEGWLLRSQSYYEFEYPNSKATYANALNFQQQVVGWYKDSKGETHGYVLTNPTSPSGAYWQSVDEPNAAGVTMIYSINGKHSISGCYVDSSGNTDGFVGILKASD